MNQPKNEWEKEKFKNEFFRNAHNKVMVGKIISHIDTIIEKVIYSDHVRIKEELEKKIEKKKKQYPKNIKQEIWGGEGGLPNIKIESSDFFGIKFVDGFNQALSEVHQIIEEVL